MKKHRENRFYRVRMDTARNLRIRLGALILGTLAFFPIAARLLQLTVVDHGYYTAKALNNQTRSTAASTPRRRRPRSLLPSGVVRQSGRRAAKGR